jgi:hypothetical protein
LAALRLCLRRYSRTVISRQGRRSFASNRPRRHHDHHQGQFPW